jgi:hypothetical protein
MKHPLNAGVHFLFFDEFAARDLVNSNLHLLLKPLVVGKQPRHSFLHKIIGVSSGFGGQIVKLRFLNLRQIDFHSVNLRIPRAGVKITRVPAVERHTEPARLQESHSEAGRAGVCVMAEQSRGWYSPH